MKRLQGLWILLLAMGFGVITGIFQQVSADRFQSTNYTIDATMGASFGGTGTSANYKLVGTGGESIVGNGSGGSYKLTQPYFTSSTNSLELTVQPSDLIAYYSLDEGSGTVAHDASTNNYNANFIGSPTWGAGKIGSSVTVGPSTSNGVHTTEASFGNPTQFTVCAWVYYTVGATNPSLVARGNGGLSVDGMWVLGLNAGTGARAQIRLNGVTTTITGADAVIPNAWTQLCETYNGVDFKLYANGVEVATATINQPLPAVSSILSIGGKTNLTAAQLPNPVDEVKYFSRAFTAREIQAEYSAIDAGIPAGLSLNSLVGGTSQVATLRAVVKTDASGYDLTTRQNQNLTKGGDTIPSISGSIASPLTWSEGSTKGLGFTLLSTNATAIPGKWSSGNAFAAFPNTDTSFYTRTGLTGGVKDYLDMRIRADVATAQPAGDYSNIVTWTGVMAP